MTMESTKKRYGILNRIARRNCTVLFGGSAETDLPIDELRVSYGIDEMIYNRSLPGLKLEQAAQEYDCCVRELEPDTVLVRLGAEDKELFESAPEQFDAAYCALIGHIASTLHKGGRIAIVSLPLGDGENAALNAKINHRLGLIAQAEKCEFADVTKKRAGSPAQIRELMDFIHSIGFVRPSEQRAQIFDICRAVFSCEN